MVYKNPRINQILRFVVRAHHLPPFFANILYVMIAGALVVLEEFIVAAVTYMDVRKLQKLNTNYEKPFDELSDDQKVFEQHFQAVSEENEHKLRVMAREASIQLTLQNSVVIYELLNPPIYELDFNGWPHASARWIAGIAFQIVSIVLSMYSTFNPIIQNVKFQSFVRGRPVGLADYFVKVFQMIVHIIISTSVVYLASGRKTMKYITFNTKYNFSLFTY